MWRYLRQFPKFIIAGLLIGGSLTILFVWEMRRGAHEAATPVQPFETAPIEDTTAKEAEIEAKHSRLLVVDNDLYDLDTGAVIFKGWLKDDMPLKLFYDGESKKLLAQYPNGFIRYDLAGREEAKLLRNSKPAFSDDFKWAVYVKDKDIWRADVDWKELKFVNEKKVTGIEQFFEASFADNIFLGTDDTLIVRNLAKVIRVNLDTGDVKPSGIPLLQIGKRRSPDSKWVVGIEKGQFYCYDVDRDETSASPVGRVLINNYQWLGNDKCAGIASAKVVVLYDRLKNSLTEVVALPSLCFNIGDPSSDGRYVFCGGGAKWVLVDLEKKTAVPVVGGAGLTWVSNDTFAFSREVPDSDLRGTWLQTAGEAERRVSPEPYLVNRVGGDIMTMQTAGMIVFATKHGLSK